MSTVKKVLKQKKEHGNILLAAFLMVIVLTIMSTIFLSTTIAVNDNANKIAYSKQAYYSAEAGIERACMILWNNFKDGMMSSKIREFRNYVDTYNTPGDVYLDNNSFGSDGKQFSVTMVRTSATTDNTQVSVRLTSTGTAFIKTGANQVFKQKTIVADVNYSLRPSDIFDFAYFGNNFSWQSGVNTGGSIASNGFVNLKSNARVAGADRYKFCKFDGTNYELISKIDDGGIYSGTALVDPNARWGYSDMYPNKPDLHDKTSPSGQDFNGGDGIRMPSLADHSFYIDYINEEEDKALHPGLYGVTHYPPDNVKDRYGIYVWVPAGTPGRDNTDGYVQISDGVYGDETTGNVTCYNNNGSWVQGPEKSSGNLIITDTKDGSTNKPVKVYGSVLVKGNVIIRGKVTGTGAIYSGNNTYVVGGLTYERAPSASDGFRGFTKVGGNTSTDRDGDTTHDTSAAKTNQQTWIKNNKASGADNTAGTAKDLVGLFAGGSVILGDASGNGLSGIKSYIKQNVTIDGVTVDGNETDEAKLGSDKVPYSKKNTKDTAWETNSTWDVMYYTNDRRPPLLDPNNAALGYAINPFTNRPYSYLTGPQKTTWESVANGKPSFYEDYKTQAAAIVGTTVADCVIPGSGEDIDGDGVYDPKMKPKDAVCFTPAIADSLGNSPSDADIIATLKLKPAEWGGTFNLGNDANGQAFSTVVGTAGGCDALIYTNHLAGGNIGGPTNGCYIVRIEATTGSNLKSNHDDRVMGGGALSDMSMLLPSTPYFEIIGWKEL
jgi:hypothetical protein